MLNVVSVYSNYHRNHRFGPLPVPFHTFLYIKGGEAHYWLNQSPRPVVVSKGSLLWLPRLTVREMHTGAKGLHQMAIRFRVAGKSDDHIPDELAADLPPSPRVVTVSGHASMEQLFREAEHLVLSNGPAAMWGLRAVLMQVLARYLQAVHAEGSPHVQAKVNKVQTYMLERLAQPDLSCAELAAAVGWSQAHLIRTFRQVTGETPMAYLRRLRINRSIDLLRTGEFSIVKVAELCGFNDPAYFSRAFRQQVGEAPSRFLPTFPLRYPEHKVRYS